MTWVFSGINCGGSEIETRNRDRLAEGEIHFVNFHNVGNATLAEVIQSAGYRTLLSSKWNIASTPPQRTFKRHLEFLTDTLNFFTEID